MEQIQLASVYAFVAFLYTIGPIVTWLTLWQIRNRGVNLWCTGGLLLSAGILLAAGKDVEPSPWLMGASNILMFAAIVIRIQALLDFVGKKIRVAMWLVLGALFIFVYEYLILHNIEPLIYVLVVQILILGRTSYVCYLISQQPNSKSIIWTAYTYALMAIVMVSLVIAVSMGVAPADYLATNPFTVALLLTGVLSSLTGYLGIIGLILDRARAKETEALIAHARAESSLALGGQIARLQRQHIVGQMSGILSHELSQPLTAALWSVQTAERQLHADAPQEHEALESLHRGILAIRKTSEVLDRIRSFVKPGELLKTSRFDYTDMVREVIEISRALAARKSVRIQFEAPAEPVRIRGDKVQLSQVLLNLLVNAIDAAALSTSGQGFVKVEISTGHNRLNVTISDNGPGFDSVDLEKAGEPFYTSKPDGLGLGLSIARNIVDQHGGELSWGNARQGGACLNLCLPVNG